MPTQERGEGRLLAPEDESLQKLAVAGVNAGRPGKCADVPEGGAE